jgi:pyrroline-5-carboxylate reductase
MISVVLLGAGNVATHLYKAFSKTENVSVVQWYNRTRSSISSYVNEVDITDQLEELKEADLYILAVSDDSIAQLSQNLPFKNRLIAHTSGSVAMHDLDKKNEISVFYPLQTFSKNSDLDFTEVPICI